MQEKTLVKAANSAIKAGRSCMRWMALLFICACRLARAGEPERPAGTPPLVADVAEAFLVGVDDRYVYWVDRPVGADGTADQTVQRLRRVGKQGGTPELLTDLHGDVESACGAAIVGGRALLVLHGETPFDQRLHIVAVDTAKPEAPKPVGEPRTGLCNLIVQGDRLYWSDEEGDGGVWSARLDGSGAKRLWNTPARSRIERVVVHGRDPVLLVWTQLPDPPEREGMGLGTMGIGLGKGKLGEDPTKTADAMLIPRDGRAKSLWHAQGSASDLDADANDLVICTQRGIVRVPNGHGGKATPLTRACRGELRLWRGWSLEADGDVHEGAPLVARKVNGVEPSVQIVPRLYGGARNLVLDADAVYGCAVGAKPERCDLARLPDPASLDHAPGAAKSPAP
jgi:hypothetical protein